MEPKQPPQWMAHLDERTRKHVDFARAYAQHFAHGAAGHIDLMTIARLSQLIENLIYRGDIAAEPKATPGASDLLTPAEAKPIDLTRAPDASKKPKSFC